MSTKKITDKDVIENVIDIALRMYGNGHSYSRDIVNCVTEYCREQVRYYFIEHRRLIDNNNKTLFLHTLIYRSRHKQASLKRLQQFVQAKDRPPPSPQDPLMDQMVQDKKVTITDRFNRICHQLNIHHNNNADQVNQLFASIK